MGTIIWFTGLSGSGKTTIAQALKKKIEEYGKSAIILDADDIRSTLNTHLGFSREDIRQNNVLIAHLAKRKSETSEFILVPIISPYREDREKVKSILGNNFIELFVNSPLEKCIQRDVKGLYKKALNGEIKNFIGIAASNPYEPPLSPEIEVNTEINNIVETVILISEHLKRKKLI